MKKLAARRAVAVKVVIVYSLFVEKVCKNWRQIRAAMMSRMGFMKFEPSGVDAAKITSPAIRPTRRQTASGPLVINPVMVPMPLFFFRHSIIISIASAMRTISKIIPEAPINDRLISPPNNRAHPQKNTSTSIQMMRSSRPIELKMNFFKIIWLCFVAVDKSLYHFFA